MDSPSIAPFNTRLDAILWHPATTQTTADLFCTEAIANGWRAVCVSSSRVAAAAARLEDSHVKVVALIGFPLGTTDGDAKRYEAELAFDLGAHEVEVVLDLGRIKEGDVQRMRRELGDVVAVADERPVGVVIEFARLSAVERQFVAEALHETGVQRICTSTDFWPDAQVTVADLKALREALNPKIAIKAVGGLRERPLAEALLAAGAATIGSVHARALVSS
jgi:deoxyribose-phosphate aldolase